MNDKDIIIALPKGRILKQVLPIFDKVGIIPEKSFFNEKDRKLKFETNIPNIKLIIVRSFDVATFLIYGAAHIAIIGSDVLEEFNHSEIYSPIDLKIGFSFLVLDLTFLFMDFTIFSVLLSFFVILIFSPLILCLHLL